ncbi:hypothetical protein B0T26DRAFT_641533 [Lasiosphaeria miniovina]|uniref:Microbial-type PARG catalytic domain-containing protein n=1 Tax=Lasiosphaeria miniovina TaxID=1954250 RepID=A0AA40ATH0_9PEZI|nr:uncharacterized protein B0T26DRAFT_641533 [Lasiosphaeria miniovina]KAK0721723.1 hypothetical protein B0T26DRAFT_641533 [Lasiosphaeria miniovina]
MRDVLRDTARITKAVLPPLLKRLGRTDDARYSIKHTLSDPLRLDPALCPRLSRPARILVVNDDTLNAAIKHTLPHASPADMTPPAVANFANRERPGGGWLNGAMAQEESLCYRTSLSLSLDASRCSRHYPLSAHEAEVLYSPYVVVLRNDFASGHRLLLNSGSAGDAVDVRDLPVVSVLSVSAIQAPQVRRISALPGTERHDPDKYVFQRDRDRNLTKDNMRLVLRTAASYGHRQLVLGALGCGVYANPPEDVAHCWREVLREDEFGGNWWRSVIFAVYDAQDGGNYEIFKRILGGLLV